jgi:hypothetical protein
MALKYLQQLHVSRTYPHTRSCSRQQVINLQDVGSLSWNGFAKVNFIYEICSINRQSKTFWNLYITKAVGYDHSTDPEILYLFLCSASTMRIILWGGVSCVGWKEMRFREWHGDVVEERILYSWRHIWIEAVGASKTWVHVHQSRAEPLSRSWVLCDSKWGITVLTRTSRYLAVSQAS